MPHETPSRPSFSPAGKWLTVLHLLFLVALVLSVVVMLNYLGQRYFTRLQLSARTRVQLSPMTVNLLHSLTNRIRITIFYDKTDPMYTTVEEMLGEYHRQDGNLTVRTLDYLRDPAEAQKLKSEYKLGGNADKNIVVFDSGLGVKIVQGEQLSKFVLEEVPNDKEREFRKRPTEFFGEKLFTGALLAVTTPCLNAYFLQGHGEPRLDSNDRLGLMKLKLVFEQNRIAVQPLWLEGTNGVPPDCNLLVMAGPTDHVDDSELNKVDDFLSHGGRLLVLFTMSSLDPTTDQDVTGLDKWLAKWGVAVGNGIIVDQEYYLGSPGNIVVREYDRKHPVVNPLLDSRLQMICPRAVGALKSAASGADAPQVQELAFTSAKSASFGASRKRQNATPQRYPLMVAVEKGALQSALTQRGATRLLVVGDSTCLGNLCIDAGANRDFAGYAANWLLDRGDLLRGVGPQPINEYRFLMTKAQAQSAEAVLLGAMPGSALLLGVLVWLRRRS